MACGSTTKPWWKHAGAIKQQEQTIKTYTPLSRDRGGAHADAIARDIMKEDAINSPRYVRFVGT